MLHGGGYQMVRHHAGQKTDFHKRNLPERTLVLCRSKRVNWKKELKRKTGRDILVYNRFFEMML